MKKPSLAYEAMRKEQFNFEHYVSYLEDVRNFNPYIRPIHPGQAFNEKTVKNTFDG